MIISDDKKFVFVHIPKCAGTSVRKQLSSYNTISEENQQRTHHPELGYIHQTHIPLMYLKDQFPDHFAKLTAYRSFAFIRDPRARFVSAVVQRLTEFEDVALSDITDKKIIASAKETIEWLQTRDIYCDAQYIHFSKQSAYVFLDRSQIVENLFPVDDLTTFADWLRTSFAIRFETEQRENVHRLNPMSELAAIKKMIRPMYRRVVHPDLRAQIFETLRRLGVYTPAAKLYDKVLENKDIADFIDDYYADDFALLDKVTAVHADSLAKAG